jgi:hypothetical protein
VGYKLQCSVEKGKGIVPTEMDGCIVSGVDRSCPLVNVTPSCLNMEVFSGEENTLLTSICEWGIVQGQSLQLGYCRNLRKYVIM